VTKRLQIKADIINFVGVEADYPMEAFIKEYVDEEERL
jgi:hypothetical protein